MAVLVQQRLAMCLRGRGLGEWMRRDAAQRCRQAESVREPPPYHPIGSFGVSFKIRHQLTMISNMVWAQRFQLGTVIAVCMSRGG